MSKVKRLIERAGKPQDGFSDIKLAAEEILATPSAKDNLALAKELFDSEVYQARMLAAFIFGGLAARSESTLKFLHTQVSRDEDWRVQEILAQAFERYCLEINTKNHHL